MKIVKAVISGFAAGAAAMYFGDPNRGKRRRTIARDKVNSAWHDAVHEFDKAGRDLRNRSQGVVSAVKNLAHHEEADEAVLVERVRATIGRAVSHPHAVSVLVEQGGRVTLDGPILKHEVEALLKRVWAVPGVKEVIDRLDVRSEAGGMAALQGGRPRGQRPEAMRRGWRPATRVGVGALAGTAILASARNEGPLRLAGAVAGGALLARALGNRGLRQLIGMREKRGTRVVDLNKTVHILAPIEEVFAFWSRFGNFPKFMTHLKEVRDLGNGRSHWVAEGPAGISISWDAEITDMKKNERLAWKSVSGSTVDTGGVVRFTPGPNGGTQVSIRMSYTPPAGFLGHSLAWLFGSDPKREMDDDLMRLKSLLEYGKTRAHGSPVWRDQLEPAG
jgi:uncharacterized membrane protein